MKLATLEYALGCTVIHVMLHRVGAPIFPVSIPSSYTVPTATIYILPQAVGIKV